MGDWCGKIYRHENSEIAGAKKKSIALVENVAKLNIFPAKKKSFFS